MGRLPPALLVLLTALVPPGGAAAQSAARPTVAAPVVLPYIDPPPADLEGVQLVDRQASAQCGGEPVTPAHSEPLPPRVFQTMGAPDETGEIPYEVLEFAISEDGRPGAIRSATAARPFQPGSTPGEVEASLAAWRFAPGARKDCRLTISHNLAQLSGADPVIVARALALAGRNSPFSTRLRQALYRPTDDCDRQPRPRIAEAVDRRNLAPSPGSRGWVVVRATVLNGRAADLEVLDASSQSAADEGRRALSETVFQQGSPAVGCIFTFARYGEPALAYEPPPAVEAENRCSAEDAARVSALAPAYPPALLERGIEGWAVVRYDLASWGRVGGLEVIASEPASAFGESARHAYQTARVTPTFDHARGCVQRLRFRLPAESGSDDEDN